MTENAAAVSTQELWTRLFQASSADAFLDENGSVCELPAFSRYITELCAAKGEKPERVIRRGNLDSSYGHRLFSGNRAPSRDTVLQLAFGFGMNADEAQQLLKVAHAAPLHPKVKRDAVIAFCLYHRQTLEDAQLALFRHDLPLLGGKHAD